MKKLTGMLLFTVLGLTLQLAGCADSTYSNSGSSEPVPFLPTSNLPTGLDQLPAPLTSDVEQLKTSFSLFSIDEASAGDEDYYMEWDDTDDYSLGGKFLNPESSRKRDQATLTIAPPSLTVYREDSDFPVRTYVSWGLSFKTGDQNESQLYGIEAFCNGILVEVSGEAFKLPSDEACPSTLYLKHGVDVESFGLFGEDPDSRRMLMLMSQNPFTIKVVGVDGKERSFFYDGEKGVWSKWSVQDYIRIGLEAEQAVLLGYGY
jgi:hypothetical protein